MTRTSTSMTKYQFTDLLFHCKQIEKEHYIGIAIYRQWPVNSERKEVKQVSSRLTLAFSLEAISGPRCWEGNQNRAHR